MTANGKNITFKYNDAGIRTQKVVDTVKTDYHLVGDKVTYEDNGTEKIYYSYDNSDHLISMNLNGEEYFYIRNAQGDIIALYDKSGVEVVRYSYDSFGKLTASKAELDDLNDNDKNGITGSLATTVGIKNPYRYRGYRYDSEIGLYYLQSRYYNPSWGRFLNADAIIGSVGELLGHNVFAYCKNNFVNGKDPSGFRPIYTEGEETEEMRAASLATMSKTNQYNYQSKSSPTKKDSFNTGASVLKSLGSGLSDTVSGKMGSNIIKERSSFKPIGVLGILHRTSDLGKGAIYGRRAIGLAGTVGFTTWDVVESLQQGEYVGAGIDILSALGGVGFGVLVGLGTAALVTASTPVWVVGALGVAGFGLTTLAGVGIDKYETYKKDVYYGR